MALSTYGASASAAANRRGTSARTPLTKTALAPKSLALSPASAKSNHVPSATPYHPNATGNATAQNPSSTMTYAIVPA